MELKHTNSPIAFLCPSLVKIIITIVLRDLVDLTSSWCLSPSYVNDYNLSTLPITLTVFVLRTSKQGFAPTLEVIRAKKCRQNLTSVPMAMRKYLFPFRTQKSSSSAAIILPKVGN